MKMQFQYTDSKKVKPQDLLETPETRWSGAELVGAMSPGKGSLLSQAMNEQEIESRIARTRYF